MSRAAALWLILRSGTLLTLWLALWSFAILGLAMTWGAAMVMGVLELLLELLGVPASSYLRRG